MCLFGYLFIVGSLALKTYLIKVTTFVDAKGMVSINSGTLLSCSHELVDNPSSSYFSICVLLLMTFHIFFVTALCCRQNSLCMAGRWRNECLI